MKSSQLLLTFLLNAVWQVALIAGLAASGSWLLRNSIARYRHWLWSSALCLAFFVPAVTASQMLLDTVTPTKPLVTEEVIPPLVAFAEPFTVAPATTLPSTFRLNQTFGLALLAVYFGCLLYRSFKLVQAWRTTRAIRRHAVELEPDARIAQIIRRCELALGTRARKVTLLRSKTLPVPVTVGLFDPAIILPEPLLREGNLELLTSAISHEFIHVARHDYLLNFIYELLFVPISFHPAAALLRRRVKQTRELCCDELVAERILNAEVYARSLVRLASSAPPLRRLSVTTTVGIADADILEARIMSLLRKPELNTRWKKLLLIVVSLLLLVPCAAAATYAMRFDVEPSQDPAAQKEKEAAEMKMRSADPSKEDIKWKIAGPEIVRKREMEIEMRAVQQAALIRLAKINMDQAIQIATSQQSGKVMMCTLQANHWKEPGVLADDGFVFYHVVIADEANAGASHVWVNAVDGSIIRNEKELPRKTRKPEEQ